jgi:NAD(P)-dependent dehydrogenase (short-subunit alcohol dehydrogenase family)
MAARSYAGRGKMSAESVNRSLEGRVCVVTGAASGMGRATAIEMARRGARVVVTDINRGGGADAVDEITAAGGEAIFIPCNLRSRTEIESMTEAAAKQYGGIDVLLNNAAVGESALTDRTSTEELPEEIWDTVYEINLKALWLTSRAAIPHLKQSKSGTIINVASTGAFVAYPMSVCYCATKGAVVMLTKAMAVDLAKYGIRVNCYCPGTIDTPMAKRFFEAAEDKEAIIGMLTGAQLIPRLGRPEEIAKLACFLASDDASFITGAVYVIDGGALAWRGTRD